MKRHIRWLLAVILISSFLCIDAWTSDAKATNRLRIFSIVVTTEAKTSDRTVTWIVPQEKLQTFTTQLISSLLRDQGIYDLITEGELETLLGGRTLSAWQWKANDLARLKDLGRRLNADYALYFERAFRTHLEFDMRLINLTTGQAFAVANYIPTDTLRRLPNEQKKQAGIEAIKITYRQLFSDAKGDLLQTAIGKGKIAEKPAAHLNEDAEKSAGPDQSIDPPPGIKETPLPPPIRPAETKPPEENFSQKENRPAPIPSSSQPSQPPSVKPADRQTSFENALDRVLSGNDQPGALPRLVVFDFDAAENLKVVGLILTESLREALLDRGGLVLVNRENILKILDEYKLRSSGLVDEAQAVKLGKWLTADDAILGNLAVLGNTSILQVKRVNIETLGTVSMGSLRCETGREDELLNRMTDLARKLTQTNAP